MPPGKILPSLHEEHCNGGSDADDYRDSSLLHVRQTIRSVKRNSRRSRSVMAFNIDSVRYCLIQSGAQSGRHKMLDKAFAHQPKAIAQVRTATKPM
jgi:hypothetical protein